MERCVHGTELYHASYLRYVIPSQIESISFTIHAVEFNRRTLMKKQGKRPETSDKNTITPRDDKADKENLKQKEEQREVSGRHKNDGQKGHKGRR